MKTYAPSAWKRRRTRVIWIVILSVLLSAWWLFESKFLPKEPTAKEVSTNGLSSLLASQKISSQTNKQPLSIRTNSSIVPNPIVATSLSGTIATNTNGVGQISASALKQIAALEKEKESRTPTQQKIDSQLLYADKMRRGVPIADGVPVQRVDLDRDDQGRILVDIKADVTDSLLQYIKTLGGNVVNDFPQYQAIRAGVPLANIEDLAARTEVKFVEPAVRAMNNTVDSEGDYTHQTHGARTTFGINGTGVKVGVLSDSVDYLTTSQIAGKVTVLSGQSGEPATGEGTAMLEIVNDLAPGAQLYFATGSSSDASFANNIQSLQAAGCNIIVDDEQHYDESPFQDGMIAQAVNTVTANGVLYFSSANNAGNKDDGTSGTWEGDFSDSGQTFPQSLSYPKGGRIHSFGSANYNTCLGSGPGGSELRADLFWSDPLGASTNDYDLYVVDPTGSSVVASSTDFQNGSQDPYESVGTITNGELIVIVKFSGVGRFLHLSTGRGLLSVSTQGSTGGHNCATNAFNVAATDVNNSYPFAFSGGAANPVETFSSDGPRRVFFQANGTPITSGNFSSTGGMVRQKPDITAADGAATDFPNGGLNPFYGTSCAAPHAAAIAALLKSYNTNLTASQIRMVLTNATLDIMSPGADRDSGAGIVMALTALQSVEPDLTRGSDLLNNLSPHAGDTITASLNITNQFCSLAGNNVGLFHVGFYWSANASFVGASLLGEVAVNGCAANASVPLNVNVPIGASVTPGIYYLGYKIDDENETVECNESDKGIYHWTVTVLPPPQPDLTRETDSLTNLNPHPGDTITPSITITNEPCTGGSTNAGSFHVGFYWSTNTSSLSNYFIGAISVSGCASNGTVSLSPGITIATGTVPGIYYLGYKIDNSNEVDECNGGNNPIYYWTVTVAPTNTTPPTINFNRSGNNFVLTWPTNAAGFSLQDTASLSATSVWSSASSPVVNGSNYVVTNTISGGAMFYRLKK
jgi:hypothetical protein